jgi:hypothetical protein
MIARERTFALLAMMFAVQSFVLAAMGHPWICKCGTVKLWHGDVFSPENSQQVTDWYTFGHVNHGLLFYGIFWLIARTRSLDWRLLAVGLTGVVWEVVENIDMVINRFRAVTISLDYYGDSVLNSVFDSLFMGLGFLIAARVPVWAVVALVVGTEALTTTVVRDGLALNTLMLLYPVDAVKNWQMAGWTH